MRPSTLLSTVVMGLSCVAFAGQEPAAQAADPKVEAQKKRHEQDVKNDIETGKKYSEEVEKELKLSKDQAGLQRIQAMGAELAQIANSNPLIATWGDKQHSEFPYTFKLLEGDDVNAFSLPGGYIYVYEGLLKFAESDDEVAGVLAHEISHAAFRHVATLQKEQSKLQLVQIPLILATIFSGGRAGGELLQLSTLVGTALTSGWSVNAEQASDFGGFQILTKSKYSPIGMFTFMERLAKKDRVAEGAIDWGIYRTHPPSRERADALADRLKAAGVPLKRSLVTTSFRTTAKEVKPGVFELSFGSRKLVTFGGADAQTRANAAVARLNDFFDTVPAMFELRRAGSKLYGHQTLLFELRPEDAAAIGASEAEAQQKALDAMRRAVYNLTFRVWDER